MNEYQGKVNIAYNECTTAFMEYAQLLLSRFCAFLYAPTMETITLTQSCLSVGAVGAVGDKWNHLHQPSSSTRSLLVMSISI